jgi:protocatechuate 3,4-dioxygenase beta subunit
LLAFAAAFFATRAIVGARESARDAREIDARPGVPAATAPLHAAADPNKTDRAAANPNDPPEISSRAATPDSSPARAAAPSMLEGTLTGVIVDFSGKPVPGARCMWVTSNGQIHGGTVDCATDAAGRFAVKISKFKQSSRQCSLLTRAPHHFDTLAGPFDLVEGAVTDVGEIRLEGAGRVKVRVTDSSGRPFPNIVATLDDKDEAPTSSNWRGAPLDVRGPKNRYRLTGMTGEDGSLVFEPVWPGRNVVWIESPDSKGWQSQIFGFDPASRAIEVVPGREELLEWSAKRSATLSGRATARGKPLANQVVSLVSPVGMRTWTPVRATTDSDGNFAFPPVPVGEYSVRKGDHAVHFDIAARVQEVDDPVEIPIEWAFRYEQASRALPGDEKHKITLHEGATRADFDFGSGAAVELTIVDARTRKPAPRALTRIYDEPKSGITKGPDRRLPKDPSASKPTFDRRSTAGADGIVKWDDVPEGTWRVSVQAPNYHRMQLEIAVGPAADIRRTIPLDAGGTIRGKVVNTDGTPVAGAMVVIAPSAEDLEPIYNDSTNFETASPSPRAIASDDGAFEITGVSPGTQRILAFSSTHAPASVDVTVPADDAAEGVVVQLQRFGRLLVTVHRGGAGIPQFSAGIQRFEPGSPVPSEAWADDLFFETIGATSDFMGSRGSPDGNGIVTIVGVPPGVWTLDILLPTPDGAPPTPPFHAKATAVAGRDVPVFVELP